MFPNHSVERVSMQWVKLAWPALESFQTVLRLAMEFINSIVGHRCLQAAVVVGCVCCVQVKFVS